MGGLRAGDVTSNISPLTSELRGASPRRSTQKSLKHYAWGIFVAQYFLSLPPATARHRLQPKPDLRRLNPLLWLS